MKHALFIACGPCWRPHWHPDGNVLSAASRHGGVLVHSDGASFTNTDRFLIWNSTGDLALAKARKLPPQVIHWPNGALASPLPAGKYCWTDPKTLARATKQSISTLRWGEGGREETHIIKPPPGERWAWVHGLGGGSWAALRWSQAERSVGLSRWRGNQWPIEHLRLPQIESLLPTQWGWSTDNESWVLLAQQDCILAGWTFPQGLEWLRKSSPAHAACLTDQGVFWAEGATVIYLDRASQEMTEWVGDKDITGMAWNQPRRCLALASGKGIDILLA